MVWCSLRDENLVTSSSDLMLKHGTNIAGSWEIIGILDATPGEAGIQTETSNPLSATPIGDLARSMGPAVQTLMGRPAHAYGLNALMIFRRVVG
jgi:hypothetical protein